MGNGRGFKGPCLLEGMRVAGNGGQVAWQQQQQQPYYIVNGDNFGVRKYNCIHLPLVRVCLLTVINTGVESNPATRPLTRYHLKCRLIAEHDWQLFYFTLASRSSG